MTYRPPAAHSEAVRVETGMRFGAYEILLCIARGGMASVWAARQHGARGFSRLVALKTILPELAAPDLDGMFLDEARVTARIHHPNVCEVFELIEHGGVLALSMEWVDGDTLNNVISGRPKDPALDLRLAAQIVAHVACGLHAAHELRDDRGLPLELVHRDVSPQNILISRSGHVKVTDFGVAKSLGGVREATAVGKVKGKLSYMSPEQAQGQTLDRRSDIFSLGVVLYLATVGSHPFRRSGESRHQQLSRLLANKLKKPSELVENYPKPLEAIVLRALSREPDQRFASADEMAKELQEWVLSTGPLVTEHQIAAMMLERAGATILERSEHIANLMCKQPDEPSGQDQVPVQQDPTLVPITGRSTESQAPSRRRSAFTTLRAVSTTLTAAAIAVAASFVFSTPPTLAPSRPLAAPLTELTTAAARPPLAAAPALPAPSVAPAPGKLDSAGAANADGPPPKAKPSPVRPTRATKADSVMGRAGKAERSGSAKRKRPARDSDPYDIKRGR